MIPTKFRSIWPSCVRVEDFKKSTNQKQELPVVAMIVNGLGKMSNLYREPSIDASYQVLVHLVQVVSEEKISLEINQSETRIVCGGNVC